MSVQDDKRSRPIERLHSYRLVKHAPTRLINCLEVNDFYLGDTEAALEWDKSRSRTPDMSDILFVSLESRSDKPDLRWM